MLIRVQKKDIKPRIKLVRVSESNSGKAWVFTFADTRHMLMQSVIYAKAFPGDAMEQIWDELHEKWQERMREEEWKAGQADLPN